MRACAGRGRGAAAGNHHAAAERRGDYCLALEALDVPLLTHRAGNSFMSDVYVCAKHAGFEELVRLLSRPDSSRVFNNTGESSSDEIPSGVRVSMAKRGNRQQLERMFSDPNAQVIRTLLKNPGSYRIRCAEAGIQEAGRGRCAAGGFSKQEMVVPLCREKSPCVEPVHAHRYRDENRAYAYGAGFTRCCRKPGPALMVV